MENPRFRFSSVIQPDIPTLTSETTEGSTAISTSNSPSSDSSLASYLGSASSESQSNQSSLTVDLRSAFSKSQPKESSFTKDLRTASSKSLSNESSLTRDSRSAYSMSQSNEPSFTSDLGTASTGPFPSGTNSVSVQATLSGGAIGGITVGGAIVLVAIVAGIVAACCYRRRRRRQPQEIPTPKPLTVPDSTQDTQQPMTQSAKRIVLDSNQETQQPMTHPAKRTVLDSTQDTQQAMTHPAKRLKPCYLDPPSSLIPQPGSLDLQLPNPADDPGQELKFWANNVSTACCLPRSICRINHESSARTRQDHPPTNLGVDPRNCPRGAMVREPKILASDHQGRSMGPRCTRSRR